MSQAGVSGDQAVPREPGEQREEPQLEETGKRKRFLSVKALQNAVSEASREADCLHKKLLAAIRDIDVADVTSINESSLTNLEAITQRFQGVLGRLLGLLEQDKYGKLSKSFLIVEDHAVAVNEACRLINKLKSRQTDKSSAPPKSHHSRGKSSVKSNRSSVRLRALAEVASAKETADYDKMIAEQEYQNKQRVAQEEIRRAAHQKEIAILNAKKKAAVAEAKLKAIEEAISDEEISEQIEIPGVPQAHMSERVTEWVDSTALRRKPSACNNNTRKYWRQSLRRR